MRVARLHKPGASSLTVWQPVERGGLSAGKAVVTLGHHASTALDAVPARGAAMVVEARAPLVPLATRPAGLLAERSRNRPIGARHAHRVHLPRRRERPAAGVARAWCRRCPEPSTNLLGTLLQAALDQVLPPPERYLCVWHVSGPEPLSIWQAVPPSKEFVPLGSIVTCTGRDQQPPLDAMRCVPKAWATKAAAPELIWEGSEGCIWQAAAMGVLLPTRGRAKPDAVLELDPRKMRLEAPAGR